MADHHQLSKTFPVKPKLTAKPRSLTQSPESRYWSSFKPHPIPDLFSAVSSVGFSPDSATFAAAHSNSISLFRSQTLAPERSISNSRDVVSSVSYRPDGLLLAVGDLSGMIKVFDVMTWTPLRRLRATTRAVRFVKYPRADKLHLLAGGDDAVVRHWDVASETPITELVGHKDYVRCGDFSPASDDTFVTGSYDHTVKLWDVRVGDSSRKASIEVDHGKPVESVAFLPSGGMVATAGGNSVKIWDLIGGGNLVCSMESHNKTVTSLCLGKFDDEYRIISVALDGYLKVFDYGRSKVTYSARFPAPLMSVALAPDSTVRAIGTSNGTIFAGKRKGKLSEEAAPVEQRALRPSYFRYFTRGQGEKASEGEFVIARPKKTKAAEHDKLLRQFRHKEALAAALAGKNPVNLAAVIEELVARRKLVKSLENLEGDEVGSLLGVLGRYAADPAFAGLLIGVAYKVAELKAGEIRASPELRKKAMNLKRGVEEEMRTKESLQEMMGMISPLLRLAGRR